MLFHPNGWVCSFTLKVGCVVSPHWLVLFFHLKGWVCCFTPMVGSIVAQVSSSREGEVGGICAGDGHTREDCPET